MPNGTFYRAVALLSNFNCMRALFCLSDGANESYVHLQKESHVTSFLMRGTTKANHA